MSKNKDKVTKKTEQAPQQEEMKLDDARRVKVLSPGMLVFKRFIRNKLAVIGIIILAVMFTYSFIGPFFSPYSRQQMFFKDVPEAGDYATVSYNYNDPIFFPDPAASYRRGAIGAIGKYNKAPQGSTISDYQVEKDEEIMFTSGSEHYTIQIIDPRPEGPTYTIKGTVLAAKYMDGQFSEVNDEIVDSGLLAFITADAEAGGKETELDYNGKTVIVEISKIERKYFVTSDEPLGIATYNSYYALGGKAADLQADTDFMHQVNLAIFARQTEFTYKDVTYKIEGNFQDGFVLSDSDGAQLFNITRDYHPSVIVVEKLDKDGNPVKDEDGNTVTEEKQFLDTFADPADAQAFLDAVKATIEEKEAEFDPEAEPETSFSLSFDFTAGEETKEYSIVFHDIEYQVVDPDGKIVMEVINSFATAASKYDALKSDFGFILAAESAASDGTGTFDYQDETFNVVSSETDTMIQNAAGEDVILISNLKTGGKYPDTVLTPDFIKNSFAAVRGNSSTFQFVNQYGNEVEGIVEVKNNGNNNIRVVQTKSLLDARADLSSIHWLGTENNGMDVFTRLMYGGRVSLIVGFVVVFFELAIGVVIGGISGYFGGIVDTLLMRFVELFNAIPFYPMLIILGSVMDNLHTDAYTRLMLTMAILGILGWTGIARIVRGQILSLREQDFMIATEATGIRTSRRIFRHLIPNVMPLLIVNATAGLGGIILTESTLGFLGLGVKYPMASWGAIINQVNDMQVMKTAWWIWIPAGLLILITVLGFNFVGDGLRDAFDPKMKR